MLLGSADVVDSNHHRDMTNTTSFSTAANMLLCRSWFENRKAEHKNCHSPRGVEYDYQLPTRLLDIGVSQDVVRLCVGSDLPGNSSYMTLSHCWGKSGLAGGFKMLTQSKLKGLMNGIPIHQLSCTFQDVILVARSLGAKISMD